MELAQKKVEYFCGTEHQLERNSLGIENLRSEVEELGLLLDFTTATDKQRRVKKLLDTLEQNREVMARDDSREMIGGLRHFSAQMLMSIEQYLVHTLVESDEETARRAYSVLRSYAGDGFCVALAMVCCL